MKTLILGMGNEFLSDDAVGLEVARALAQAIDDPDVDVKETCLASLEILDLLAGYDRAVVVDAIKTRTGQVGEIHVLSPTDLPSCSTPTSLHHIDLASTLALGKRLGAKMPEDVRILAIEASDVSTFGGGCCMEVEAAIPKVIDLIKAELGMTGSG